MKRALHSLVALCATLLLLACATGSAGAYTNGRLIDNSVIDKADSMSAASIQSWLQQNYPQGCLTHYQAPDPVTWYDYGPNVSASQVIIDAAKLWQINPQAILTTLEKEEGLVSGTGIYGCSDTAFKSAMGYDCPDTTEQPTGSCVAHASNEGFSPQVSHGAWQLEFGRYRSEGDGNLGYDGDGDIVFYGYMTQGTRPRCNTCAMETFSGAIVLNDGAQLTVESGATASLYSYTPYLQRFSQIFEQFFGPGSTSDSTSTPPPPDPAPTPTPQPAPPAATPPPNETPGAGQLGLPQAPEAVPVPVTPHAKPKAKHKATKKAKRHKPLCRTKKQKRLHKNCRLPAKHHSTKRSRK
jgi:hypothetical protein